MQFGFIAYCIVRWRIVDEACADDGTRLDNIQQAVVSADYRLRRRDYTPRSPIPRRADKVPISKVDLLELSTVWISYSAQLLQTSGPDYLKLGMCQGPARSRDRHRLQAKGGLFIVNVSSFAITRTAIAILNMSTCWNKLSQGSRTYVR